MQMGQLANQARRLFDDADTVRHKSAEWDEWRACADDLIRKLEAIEKGSALADRFRAHVDEARPPLMVRCEDWDNESALFGARLEAVDLELESLVAINARVEQENDLLRDVAEAARRRRDCSGWRDDEDAELACLNALEALDAWRKSQEVPHG